MNNQTNKYTDRMKDRHEKEKSLKYDTKITL